MIALFQCLLFFLFNFNGDGRTSDNPAKNGTTNRGGGGGGVKVNVNGGNGGSGIVVIRYKFQ